MNLRIDYNESDICDKINKINIDLVKRIDVNWIILDQYNEIAELNNAPSAHKCDECNKIFKTLEPLSLITYSINSSHLVCTKCAKKIKRNKPDVLYFSYKL